jgi:hypothetical protein
METTWGRTHSLWKAIIFLTAIALGLPARGEGLKECLLSGGRTASQTSRQFIQGTREAPRNSVRSENLKWELPVIATTGVLIATTDRPIRENPRSRNVSDASDAASNYILGAEIGAAFFSYAVGCATSKDGARDAGLRALLAMGAAVGSDLAIKAATNREYPNKWNGHGEFWGGGKSFPSAHAAAAFSVAGALGRRYPSRKVRWPLYMAAASVSALRVPALRHHPSDVVIGGTLGFVIGHYLGAPHSP